MKQHSAIMKHILEVVLSVPPNSVIHLALAQEGYVHPLDFLTEEDEILDGLEYSYLSGTPIKIPGDASWLLKIFKQFIAYQHDQGIPYGENYWTNMTSAQFNIFRSSKGYDTSPILNDLIPKTIVCPSSVDVFDPSSCLHAPHGGDLGINASTSVHEDLSEPSSLSLESCNVTSQATDNEPSFDSVYDPSQNRHETMAIASVLALQAPDPATKAPRTFILAPNTRLKPPNLIPKSSIRFKESFDSPMVGRKTVTSREPNAPIKQCQMATLSIDMDLPAHLVAPETPKSQQVKSLMTTRPCLQDLCWGRQSENACSNFDFLDATSTPEVSPVHSNATVPCQSTPYSHQSTLGDYPSQPMVQDDGETALHATAMELDTLLYSKYGVYALDEVTITLEPIFASTDDADINKADSLDALDYEQDSMLLTLAFEQDAPLADTLADTLEIQLRTLMFETVPKEARHIFKSTSDKHIKHSSERFFHARSINWKHILTGNKNQWMPMSYNKGTSQLGSSYGKFIENEVHYLQSTLSGVIAMMEFDNPFNLSIKTKLRPPPSPNIALSFTPALIESPKTMQPPMCNKAFSYAKWSTEISSVGILDHPHGVLPALWIPTRVRVHCRKPPPGSRPIESHQARCTASPRLIFDGENFYASQHAPPERLFWYLRAPSYGERMSPYALMNLPSRSNCIGSSFLNPWGEKQAYTAHVGWENG